MRTLQRSAAFVFAGMLAGQTVTLPPAEFPGKLKAITKKEVILLTEEDNLLTFRRTKRTKFLKDGKETDYRIAPIGDEVVIEGLKDRVGDLEALRVLWKTANAPK